MLTKVTNKKGVLTLNSGDYALRKFRIVELLDQMPAKEARAFKKELPVFLGVSRQTFSNYCNAHINSAVDIPFSVAYRLSLVFSCPLLDLLSVHYRKKNNSKLSSTTVINAVQISGLTQ